MESKFFILFYFFVSQKKNPHIRAFASIIKKKKKSICINQCKIEKCMNFTHSISKITHISQIKNM